MPAALRSPKPVLLAALLLVGACLLLGTLGGSRASAASVSSLKQRISAGQGAISGLAGALGAANRRVNQLTASISTLEQRINAIQADLDAKIQELRKLRAELDAAQTRLQELESYLQKAQVLLSDQLVSTYESDRPDLVSVVLESTGFQDLLERISFQQRISKENVAVIDHVRAAKRAVTAQAIRLGALEVRQQTIAAQVLHQRDRLARTKISLVQQELVAARSRDAKAGRLASAQAGVNELKRQLNDLLAAQAAAAQRARAAAQAAASSSTTTAAPNAPVFSAPTSSSGGFTFPLPKSAVVSPGSWSLDQGVDMSAPGGTPEYAVCSGTVVLHGIGGFGPWAPVLHCDSTLDGYSYVYYGHAGPANQLAVGTHVSAGAVMSEVGPGIVGISTGPHIEIGFCDSSGTPIGGGSASTMLSLLHSAY